MGEAVPDRYSFAEYLALESASPIKHGYFNGQIWELGKPDGTCFLGERREHDSVVAMVLRQLQTQIQELYEGSVFSRVCVRTAGLSVCPDVTVVCGRPERDAEDRDSITNPTVLVEVLSKSTEAYDRGEKFYYYRQIPSLRDYVLVSQGVARLEHFERTANGWILRTAGPGESVTLASIGCELSEDAIDEGVETVRE